MPLNRTGRPRVRLSTAERAVDRLRWDVYRAARRDLARNPVPVRPRLFGPWALNLGGGE